MWKSRNSGSDWRSRWSRRVLIAGLALGLGVVAGLMLASRMSRPEIKVGR